ANRTSKLQGVKPTHTGETSTPAEVPAVVRECGPTQPHAKIQATDTTSPGQAGEQVQQQPRHVTGEPPGNGALFQTCSSGLQN
ncbi:Hypothetical predicted protein, partial [Pelobates cultripes]